MRVDTVRSISSLGLVVKIVAWLLIQAIGVEFLLIPVQVIDDTSQGFTEEVPPYRRSIL